MREVQIQRDVDSKPAELLATETLTVRTTPAPSSPPLCKGGQGGSQARHVLERRGPGFDHCNNNGDASLLPPLAKGGRKIIAGFVLSVWALMVPSAFGQEKSTDQPPAPIKVVTLSRIEPVDFDRDVQPILARRCLVCHSGSVTEGMLDLSKHASILEGGRRGTALVPGKSAASLLVQLAGKTQKPFMPPKKEKPLEPEELAILKLWIDQGAKPGSGMKLEKRIVLTPPPESFHPIRAVVVSPDQKFVAAARGCQIDLFDPAGNPLRSLVAPGLVGPDKKPLQAAHASLVEALAMSPDGKTLASSSYQEVILWDPATGALRRRLEGFAERVVCLAFSADGKFLATGGGAPTETGEIKIFDLASGKLKLEIKNGHSDTVFGICFSPDGKMIATGAADKFVKVFDTGSGKLLRSFEGHTQHVMDVGWKPDGKALVSIGADDLIKVWDFEKGEQIRSFGNQKKQLTKLVFKNKSPEILVASGDHTVRVWNTDNGSPGMNFNGATDYVCAVGISADGKLVSTGGDDGILRLYNGATGKLVKAISPSDAPAAPAPSK
jgi:WD40 repeat protein